MCPPQPSFAHWYEFSIIKVYHAARSVDAEGVKRSTALSRNCQKAHTVQENGAYAWIGNTGSTMCVDSMTTPNAEPPPPRSAKNKSLFWHSFAVRLMPSGVTTLIWT